MSTYVIIDNKIDKGFKLPLKEIGCHNCGTKIKKRVREAINLSENPRSVSDVIEGKINFSYCPKCKTKIEHKTHVLLTYMDPPRWIWLVSKKHQNPMYKEEFFSSVLPPGSTQFIDQEMVFVDFGEPCVCLKYVLDDKKPQNSDDWLNLGKIHTGKEAIDCYKNALKLNRGLSEAKSLINVEMTKLKSYSL